MIPKNRNINELLKRYIPSASKGQMERNSAQVLDRLRAEKDWNAHRQGPIVSLESARHSVKWRTRLLVPATVTLVLIAIMIVGSRSEAIAVVENVNGALYRFNAGKEQSLRSGEPISADESLRAAGKAGSTVTLADQSRVEMRPKAELKLERTRDGVLVHLQKGDLIVTAAQQRNGQHLYVRTKDMTVSVVGTVFLVNAEEEGSRVAVIEGKVSVQHGTATETLSSGEQLRSNLQMPVVKVPDEVSWSENAAQHMALLQQSAAASPTASVSKLPLQFENASVRRMTGGEPSVGCKGIDGVWPEAFRGDKSEVPLGRCIGVIGLNTLIRGLYDIRIENDNISGTDQEPFSHL